MNPSRQSPDPVSYRPLMELVAIAESNGNYNAYYGNAGNDKIIFTDMTIGEVLSWQRQYIKQGSPSSAVGRYQIIDSTLKSLVQSLELSYDQKFDTATQDRLAAKLIERRGADRYVNKEISKEEFAANLAKEWAALPRTIGDNPNASYYSGDGLNRSRIPVDTLLAAIQPISAH